MPAVVNNEGRWVICLEFVLWLNGVQRYSDGRAHSALLPRLPGLSFPPAPWKDINHLCSQTLRWTPNIDMAFKMWGMNMISDTHQTCRAAVHIVIGAVHLYPVCLKADVIVQWMLFKACLRLLSREWFLLQSDANQSLKLNLMFLISNSLYFCCAQMKCLNG